jgi:hypothetical protein
LVGARHAPPLLLEASAGFGHFVLQVSCAGL